MDHTAATLSKPPRGPRPVRMHRSRQAVLGQFFTPAPIATFMAGLFSPPSEMVNLLDAGAGEGALTQAFIDRWPEVPITADAYELDEAVLPTLVLRLQAAQRDAITAHAINADFLAVAATMIRTGEGQRYTRAILNPPYRKIATASDERRLAKTVGLKTVNLYSAFVGMALELLETGGELVAIIPRSFCNGPYYRPFRDWLLERAALRHIHLFGSRRDAFSDDGVLQENVIILLERGGSQSEVTISTSAGADFADLRSQPCPFADVISPGDPDRVIQIPTSSGATKEDAGLTLAELGLHVSTGPVVDFRLRDHLRQDASNADAPLLYPQHLRHGQVTWPINGKKPNGIEINHTTAKWLVSTGWYVIVKRFSSKEERRRVVAAFCDPASLSGKLLGVDNKLNIIRCGAAPLEEVLARGLTMYLNSTRFDQAFRLFSGHTQVNATDLRRMRFPTIDQLNAIGRASAVCLVDTQQAIDDLVAIVIGKVSGQETVNGGR